jgi:ribosomal-protein-alanine N-acetyltransferase
VEDDHRFISMATGHSTDFFLAINVKGKAVGGIGIHLLEDVNHRTAEIGYWISESFWGNGITTYAVQPVRYDFPVFQNRRGFKQ